jgi:phosphate:Na+ symporter
MFDSSFAALEQSKHEISRMDDKVRSMFDNLKTAIQKPDTSEKEVKYIFEREDILDNVQKEITTFLTDILGESIPHDIATEAQVQLRMADEYESISDEITVVLKLYLKLKQADIKFKKKQAIELLGIHDEVVEFYNFIHTKFAKSHDRFMDEATKQSVDITEKIRELRNKHWSRLSKTSLDPMISTTYMDIANSYRRSKDHLINIAEAICGGKMV